MKKFLKNKKILLSVIIVAVGLSLATLTLLGRETLQNFVFHQDISSPGAPILQTTENLLVPEKNFNVIENAGNEFSSETLTGQFIGSVLNDLQNRNPSPLDLTKPNQEINVGNYALDFKDFLAQYYESIQRTVDETLNKIRISNQNDSDGQLMYFAKIFAITSANFGPSELDSGEALQEYVNTNDASKLNEIIAAYQSTLEQSLVVAVPARLIRFHESYIRYLTSMIIALKDIQFSEADPLKAAAATQLYTDTLSSYAKSFGEMVEYVNSLALKSTK